VPHVPRPGTYLFLLCAVLLCAASTHAAGITVTLQPNGVTVQPGDTVVVEVVVPEAGDAFNGYDAVVGYEPDRLLFLQTPSIAQQEGELLVDACPSLRFHRFSVAEDSTYVTINHVMLCSGTTVTGPGVLYRLRFQVKAPLGFTVLRLLPDTRFYDAGYDVTPVRRGLAVLNVGTTTGSAALPRPRLGLRAAPNPFNPRTVLSFDLPEAGPVRLRIYGVDGRLVRTLLEASLDAGPHRASWDGRDAAGRSVASGPYLARLEAAGDLAVTRTLTLIK